MKVSKLDKIIKSRTIYKLKILNASVPCLKTSTKYPQQLYEKKLLFLKMMKKKNNKKVPVIVYENGERNIFLFLLFFKKF